MSEREGGPLGLAYSRAALGIAHPFALLPPSASASLLTGTMAAVARIPVSVVITSDSICPWCFIGFRRIQSAIAQAKAAGLPLDFSVSFSPFLLDPTLPASPGINKLQRYEDKYGGQAKVSMWLGFGRSDDHDCKGSLAERGRMKRGVGERAKGESGGKVGGSGKMGALLTP